MSPVKATEAALLSKQAEVLKLNQEIEGGIKDAETGETVNPDSKGLRWKAGQTRGQGSVVISWKSFDTDKPKTLPENPDEFMQMTGVTDPKELQGFLIDGYNNYSYAQASDVLFEFIEDGWSKETISAFRVITRNYMKMLNLDAETAANMVKAQMKAASK